MTMCSSLRRDRAPAGFTLTELLIASTIALMVMAGVASLLGAFTRTATNSQSVVDMTSRMRSAASRLRQDLGGATAPLVPPLSMENASGYFEIVEGPMQDAFATDADGNLVLVSGLASWATGTSSVLADVDDALLFTTRSLAGPFTGRFDAGQIESTTAEVAWFCRPSATQPVPGLRLHTLYRRQLLVVGYVGVAPFFDSGSATNNQISGALPAAYTAYDISLRADPTVADALVPNTLADLSRRENRFFHGPNRTSPFPAHPNVPTGLIFNSASGREGEDIILTNVIAFDVRVFDPDAQAKISDPARDRVVVYPNDYRYNVITNLSANAAPFRGCFVDVGGNGRAGLPASMTLGPAFTTTSILTGSAAAKSGLTATYDTWTTAYEANGLDDDSDGIIDEGTNGVDNNANNIIDDSAEDETAPPYAIPLRAIEIRIRCYDSTSKEIRQMTVCQPFMN